MGKPTRSNGASKSATGAIEAKPAKAKPAQAKPAKADAAGSSPVVAKLAGTAAVPARGKAASGANSSKPSATVAEPVSISISRSSAKSVLAPKIALAKLRRASAVKARSALAAAPQTAPETAQAAQAVKRAIDATEKAKRADAALVPLPAALLARPTPRQVLAKVKSKAQALPKRGVRLYDLRENHCRWVLDRDGHEPAFCGAPRVGSSSWCAAHRKIVYPRAALQEGAAPNGKAERPAG